METGKERRSEEAKKTDANAREDAVSYTFATETFL